MRFKFAALLCAVGVISLTGCGKTETASITLPVEQSSTPAQMKTNENAVGYPELVSVVTKTRAAVEANDFQKAQQEFDQFEGVWSQVEDGIKAKASDSYDAIEGDMDQITASLRASQTDKALEALHALESHIQSVPNS